MDKVKFERLITENMKSIFGFSLTRLGNITEAEAKSLCKTMKGPPFVL